MHGKICEASESWARVISSQGEGYGGIFGNKVEEIVKMILYWMKELRNCVKEGRRREYLRG
jgi:hypothetical protein